MHDAAQIERHTQGYQVLIQLNQEPHLTIKAAENLISLDEKSINTVKTKLMPSFHSRSFLSFDTSQNQ